MEEYVSTSIQQTYAIAKRLADRLHGGEIILLQGDLGAGKTTFVKGLALALGIDDVVTSPTFTLMNEYRGKQLKLYHFDLYRLGQGAADELGFDEFYHAPDAVCCIEWSRDDNYWGKVITVYADYVEGCDGARRYRWQPPMTDGTEC